MLGTHRFIERTSNQIPDAVNASSHIRILHPSRLLSSQNLLVFVFSVNARDLDKAGLLPGNFFIGDFQLRAKIVNQRVAFRGRIAGLPVDSARDKGCSLCMGIFHGKVGNLRLIRALSSVTRWVYR